MATRGQTGVSLDLSKAALILVDVQNDFCAPDGAMGRMGKNLNAVEAAMPPIHQVLARCRETGVRVYFVKTTHGPESDSAVWVTRSNSASNAAGVCTTSRGQEFYQVKPQEGEQIVVKHRYSAFIGTNLDLMLRAKGICTLLLCGVATNVCVESTARDGYMMDYQVITLSDCVASYQEHEHLAGLHNLNTYFGRVLSSEELLALLG